MPTVKFLQGEVSRLKAMILEKDKMIQILSDRLTEQASGSGGVKKVSKADYGDKS